MRKIILMTSISVDGFIEGPNRELDWKSLRTAARLGILSRLRERKWMPPVVDVSDGTNIKELSLPKDEVAD